MNLCQLQSEITDFKKMYASQQIRLKRLEKLNADQERLKEVRLNLVIIREVLEAASEAYQSILEAIYPAVYRN